MRLCAVIPSYRHVSALPALTHELRAHVESIIIVDDGNDAERGLPSTFGVDDLVFVLQDKRLDPAGEAVYRPGDADRMHGFLGANVGDHLRAAVANVLDGGNAHFEQALFADGLGEASVAQLRERIAAHWRSLTAELVPQLEARVAADAGLPASERRRVRVGLYSFHAAAPTDAAATPSTPTAAPTRRRRAPGASR